MTISFYNRIVNLLVKNMILTFILGALSTFVSSSFFCLFFISLVFNPIIFYLYKENKIITESDLVVPCSGFVEESYKINDMYILEIQSSAFNDFMKYSPVSGEITNIIQEEGFLKMEISSKDIQIIIEIISPYNREINKFLKLDILKTKGEFVRIGEKIAFAEWGSRLIIKSNTPIKSFLKSFVNPGLNLRSQDEEKK